VSTLGHAEAMAVTDLPKTTELAKVLGSLGRLSKPQPRSSAHLDRDPKNLFDSKSDLPARLLTAARPELRDVLYKAWANVPATPAPKLRVCALRTRAAVFGHNAPKFLSTVREREAVVFDIAEWKLVKSDGTGSQSGEETTAVWLDAPYPQIVPGSWIVL